jgi:hypothetical protein
MSWALWLSIAALLLSATALGYAVIVGRQSGATASLLARHRHGHTARDGDPDPGAARSARAGGRPPTATHGPATTAAPAVTVETAEQPYRRLPRPGEIGHR